MKAVSAWEIDRIIIDENGDDDIRALLFEDPTDKYKWTHGVAKKFQIDLTPDQAKKLVFELQMAIKNYEEMEQSVQHYMEEQKDA
jgi:hypothetical protein